MILKDKLWLVSHKEGTASPVTIERYASFVIGCHASGKSATEDWTLCTDENEASDLAQYYETINQITTKLLTMDLEGLRQVMECCVKV